MWVLYLIVFLFYLILQNISKEKLKNNSIILIEC